MAKYLVGQRVFLVEARGYYIVTIKSVTNRGGINYYEVKGHNFDSEVPEYMLAETEEQANKWYYVPSEKDSLDKAACMTEVPPELNRWIRLRNLYALDGNIKMVNMVNLHIKKLLAC